MSFMCRYVAPINPSGLRARKETGTILIFDPVFHVKKINMAAENWQSHMAIVFRKVL